MTLKEFEEDTKKRFGKKVLATYQNGNHYECILEDGTKRKLCMDDDYFTYTFPANFDFKINNRCDGCCKYCHENSKPNGEVPSLVDFIWKDKNKTEYTPLYNSIKSGTEMAIGGGNIFESKDIEELLINNKKRNILSNITVNQKHIKANIKTLQKWVKTKLVKGIGISMTSRNVEDFKLINTLGDSVVIHVINGILEPNDIPYLMFRKVLILGYKDIRNGTDYLSKNNETIKKNQEWLKGELPKLKNCLRLMTFDCLGIEQLDVKNTLKVSDEDWKRLYQGSDTDVFDNKGNITCSTMFVDLPNMKVSRMSTARLDQRFDFSMDETIESLFKKSTQGW